MNRHTAKTRWGALVLAGLMMTSHMTVGQNVPVPPIPTTPQDELTLLEMQLADARQENTRLKSDLKRTKAAVAKPAEGIDEGAVRKLEQRYTDAQAENELLKAELKRLDGELATQVTAGQKLGKDVQRAVSEVEQRQKTIDTLLMRVANSEKELETLRAAKTGNGVAAPAPTKALEELEAFRRNLEDENAILKGQVDDLKKRVAKADADRDQTKADFEKMFAGADGKEGRVRQLETELGALKATEEQRKETMDKLFRDLAALKAENRQAAEQIAGFKNEIAATAQMRSATANKVKGLESEKTLLNGQVADLKLKIRDIEREKTEIAAQVELRAAEVQKEIAKHHALQAQMDRIQMTDAQRKQAMDELLSKLAALERTNAQLDTKMSRIGAENEQGRLDLDAARAALKDTTTTMRKEQDALLERTRNAEGVRTELEAKIEQLNADHEALNGRIEELDASNAKLKRTEERRKQAMADLLDKLAGQEQKSARLEAQLTAAEATSAQAKQALAQAKAALNSETAALLKQQESVTERARLGEAKQADLSKQIADLSMKRDELAAKLSELESINTKLKRTEEQRKKSVDDLLEKLADAERKAELASGQLQTTRETLNADLQEKASKIAVLTRDNTTLKEEVARLEDDWAKVLKARDELASEVGRREVEGLRDRGKVTELETELTRLRTIDSQRKLAMDKLLIELSDAQTQNRELSARAQTLDSEIAAAKRDGRSANEAQVKGLQDKIALLETENGALRTSVADLEGKVNAFRDAPRPKDAGEWEKERKKLEMQVTELSASRDELRASHTVTQQRADTMSLELTQLQDAASTHQRKLDEVRKALETEKTNLQKRLDDALAHRDENTTALTLLKKRVAELTAERDELREMVAGHDSALGRVKESNAARIAELEKQLADVTVERNTLRSASDEGQKKIDGISLELTQLQSKLDGYNQEMAKTRETWEQEKADLSKSAEESATARVDLEKRLADIKVEVDDLRADNARMKGEIAKLEAKKAEIKRDSDLFKQVEKANVLLREKVVELEGDNNSSQKTLAKLQKRVDRFDKDMDEEVAERKLVETQLDEAKEREEEQRSLIEKLMVQVPDLEHEIATLQASKMANEQRLGEQDAIVAALRTELEKREHRLAKAERVAEVLQSARDEITQLNEKEKRDMHYNMAAVYAREGKFEDAEAEYLHALELDPMDADVHYNLAILYEDELKDSDKAEMHYRRYLKLRPHGQDADTVRQWLMKIEMKKRGGK